MIITKAKDRDNIYYVFVSDPARTFFDCRKGRYCPQFEVEAGSRRLAENKAKEAIQPDVGRYKEVHDTWYETSIDGD